MIVEIGEKTGQKLYPFKTGKAELPRVTPEKQQFRETVCNLIRYHSFPPHAIDDPDGKRKLMAIAANGQNIFTWLCRIPLLLLQIIRKRLRRPMVLL